MNQPSRRESAILLTDIKLSVPEHGNPSLLQQSNFVFINIFASRSGGNLERTFQPILKIRRLGPLVHAVWGGKDVWIIYESVDIPFSVQHVNLVVSTENPEYPSHILGNLEKDMDELLEIALEKKEGEQYSSV